ncbi:hypothetical protein B1774_04395 [Dehalococcoides mccartyi]|uniref:hypothetical protein n=1 Tax=Dehalococcoides mccartyi TaxID=61435 RepID=UPI00098F9B72|nr:hypothetical protein [Dehalococcoides mccartyi]AQU03344.1 hypothetical protein B1773_04750 [Dehalococcoides mccartyi]AQU04641.1 hypothetical protein B1774_04395 [Dehalococcoides mccartyi]
MKIQERAVLHNRFDVKVVDAVSGKTKQTAVGFNVITNYYFNSRLTASPLSKTTDLFRYIAVGTGTGTPAVTDTDLFTHLTRKAVTTLETVYEYPTSHTTKQIKLEATECNGSTITEVALEGYYSGTFSTNYYIMSHAMLQDSEGNQIAIAKTDTDVVYITATFYATCTPSGFGTNGIYPTAENNYLFQWLLTGSTDGTVRFSRFPVDYSSDMSVKYQGSKSYSFSGGTGNTTTYQYDLPVTTFLDSECNNRIVKHLGVAGVGAFTFPNHDIFPPYPVDHLVIGEGDGVTTEFSMKCPLIQSGTVRIFINDTEMTEGTDYTVDLDNNCGDWYENYHTAGLTCKSTGVSFGDLATKTPSSNYSYRDPLAWWSCYDTTVYPSSCTVNDVSPIKIDFGTAKPCNTLKIDILTIPTARLDLLKIQYSVNDTDWTDVSGLSRAGQVWKFTEVSARYWRTFLSGEGNATVVVTSSGMTGSPITLSVPVASSDTASIVAGKIKTALENNANISAVYDASVSGVDVILTAKTPIANVSSLNIALSNGTCAGLTTVSTSTNTTAGVAAVKQQENIYVTGTIGTAGNATVVVTAAGMANSPITLSVPVTSGDSSTTVAAKVNAALALNSDITDFFTISADNGRYVRLTAKTAADNDSTLNISIANDTCTGLTAIPTSTVDAAGNAGTKQVETLTVSGSVSYNWTYNLYYQSFPTRDGQSFGSTFFLGKTVSGLKFTTPPAAGASITASFALEYPFKTSNNLLRFTYSVQLQRG